MWKFYLSVNYLFHQDMENTIYGVQVIFCKVMTVCVESYNK